MKAAFFGHSDTMADERLRARLYEVIVRCAQMGVDEFLLGEYGGFDLAAAGQVKRAKAAQPQIRSVLVLAYLDRTVDLTLYDESVYPPLEEVPKRFAIVKRNEWMAREADIIICYVKHSFGGAAKAVAAARRKGKIVYNLAEMESTEGNK